MSIFSIPIIIATFAVLAGLVAPRLRHAIRRDGPLNEQRTLPKSTLLINEASESRPGDRKENYSDTVELDTLTLYKELYHKVQNIPDFPDILPLARTTLTSLLSEAVKVGNSITARSTTILDIKRYDSASLSSFLSGQHNATLDLYKEYTQRRAAGQPRELFPDRQSAIQWLIQNAPLKYVDGAWLGGIHKASTPFHLRRVTRLAWQVLSEELGDGDLSKHHVHVYRELLRSLDIHLPCADSAAFVSSDGASQGMEDPRVWKSAVAQLLISLFPNDLLPEILGFNLHFELLTNETLIVARELPELGIDGYYFTLHISIDNADSGHSAMALEAVKKGSGLCCIGAGLQGGSTNLPMFVVSRLFIGAGSVVIAGVGAPYITEIAHPAQRSTATALFLTFYALGSITAGWCTFGTFRIDGDASWRIPSALQGLPSVIQIIFIWFVPESPRWLVSKGRNEEALAMLVKYHGEGDASDPVVMFEYQEITRALSEEGQVSGTSMNAVREFMRRPGNRKRIFILVWAAICSQMSGNAFVSYYLSPILSSVGLKTDLQQTLINATSQMVSWFSALYFATLPEKLGRRTMFLWSLCAMWVIVICITAGSAAFAKNENNKAAGYSVVVFLYLFSPAYNFGFNGNLGLYIPEILPFHLRTRGLSFFYFVQFCFMILSNFAVPVGLQDIQWRLYIIFVIWIMIEIAGVYMLFPETKGPSLEDIAIIFDGPRAKDVEAHLSHEKQAVVEVN